MKNKSFAEIIRISFIFLFAYTATSKLFQPEKFKWAVSKSPLISPFTDMVVWGIPSLELAIVLCLLIPRTRRIGLYSSLCLMIIFTLYIGYMVVFTPKLPCSCGGIVQLMSWRGHLVFNSIFSGLAAWALWVDKHQNPIQTQALKSAYITGPFHL